MFLFGAEIDQYQCFSLIFFSKMKKNFLMFKFSNLVSKTKIIKIMDICFELEEKLDEFTFYCKFIVQ